MRRVLAFATKINLTSSSSLFEFQNKAPKSPMKALFLRRLFKASEYHELSIYQGSRSATIFIQVFTPSVKLLPAFRVFGQSSVINITDVLLPKISGKLATQVLESPVASATFIRWRGLQHHYLRDSSKVGSNNLPSRLAHAAGHTLANRPYSFLNRASALANTGRLDAAVEILYGSLVDFNDDTEGSQISELFDDMYTFNTALWSNLAEDAAVLTLSRITRRFIRPKVFLLKRKRRWFKAKKLKKLVWRNFFEDSLVSEDSAQLNYKPLWSLDALSPREEDYRLIRCNPLWVFSSVLQRNINSAGSGNLSDVTRSYKVYPVGGLYKYRSDQTPLLRYQRPPVSCQQLRVTTQALVTYNKVQPYPKTPSTVSPLSFFKAVLGSNRLNCNSIYIFYILGLLPGSCVPQGIQGHNLAVTSSLFRTNAVMPQRVKKRVLKKTIETLKVRHIRNVYVAHSMLSSILADRLRARIAIIPYNITHKIALITRSLPLKTLNDKYFRFHNRVGIGFFLQEAIKIAVVCVATKDPLLFLNYFSRRMEKVNFFKHKVYVDFYRRLFWDLYRFWMPVLHCKGVYLDVRGKLGVTGDAKKRHILIRYGESTLSQKAMRVLPAYTLVRTFTGVLGVTFILFY